jgi:hypothetical protein
MRRKIGRCLESILIKLGLYSWKWRVQLALRTFFGRLFHGGISKPDIWNVDSFLAPKIARTVKKFVEMILQHEAEGKPCGIPAPLSWEDGEDLDVDWMFWVWVAILWKIVDGFERVSHEDYCCSTNLTYEVEAFELFAEFYVNLWD